MNKSQAEQAHDQSEAVLTDVQLVVSKEGAREALQLCGLSFCVWVLMMFGFACFG